ncbi:MAG: O-antigen ligase family protein [Ruminococcus sp.]|nr:O-antigen ligase family protein [Ruminococcus sp.]
MIYSFIIVSVIIAALDLFKYVFFPKLHENTSLIGIFCQINHYGYFLTMMISASAVLFALESNKKLRMLNLISFIMNTVALGINSSLGPQLSTFFALIFAFVVCKLRYKSFNKDIIFLFVIYILIMLGISFFIESFFYGVLTLFFDVSNIISGDTTGSEGTGRLRIWEYTVKHIAKRPLLGYGIEGLTDEMIELNLGYGRPHNEFLQYAEFYGIPAAIIYFIGCFMIFIKGLKLREKLDIYHICAFTVVFAYLVSSAVGNTMYYTTPLFFIFIGLACSVRADLSDSK